MISKSKARVFKLKLHYVSLFEVKKNDYKPQIVVEALQKPEWKQAMEIEFKALKCNNTQMLIPYNGQKNIIDCKWTF